MSTTLHEQQDLAAARYNDRAAERAETERKQEATGTLVVDDPAQIEARAERLLGDAVGPRAVRQAGRTEGVLERIIAENDLQPSLFLGRGTAIAESVGRISLSDGGAGTGFLVGRRLLLTNNHVLPDLATAKDAFVEFDFELGPDGRPEQPAAFDLDPGTLFLTDAGIDASLVAVAPASGVVAGDRYGWNRLLKQQGKIVIGEAANVIGHPSGRRKEIAVRHNRLLDQLPDFLHYEADTEPGNSGSPVFNDQWEVVALHHSGVPRTNDAGQWLTADGRVWDRSMGDAAVAWVANEGARISVVLARLRALATTPAQVALLDELGAEALVGAAPTEAARTAPEAAGRPGLRGVPETPPHLVFLHGRSQQGRDPAVLRADWAGGLARGLGGVGRAPVNPARVWFPYYGDLLAGLADASATERLVTADGRGTVAEQVAPVGTSARATYAELIEDAAARAGFRPTATAREGIGDLLAGLQPALSWLANRSRLDDVVIAAVFRDVALYLDDDRVRGQVLDTVLATFPTSGPVTLVSHSLGTIVALDLLTRVPPQVDLRLLVTAGSPLGMDTVTKRLLGDGPHRPAVGRWVNAWCPADAVAIGCPLAPTWGGGVEDVQTDNATDRAHAITEYLADLRVASAIADTV
ncbi:V8-like Glu-specific endopeptidase [Actinomycetospora succinea]|uniref:Serine protease n=1 Tax=Actinomycetospora succinea TaxID=663603 RepID=A0A4V3DBC5_9PSEU|nr:serine protease [Actinomycetospora succinea]TDQ65988.1 V8-like Glu-specific endopeptidase [Actinomycetospora succinea]